MSGFSKNISSSLAKFNYQLAGLVNHMRGQLKIPHIRKVIDTTAEVSDAAPDAKTVNPEILDAKYMPRHLHNYQAYVRDMNKARASAEAGASVDAMPLYKNQLIRWGGAALGSQVLRGAGEYLEASRSPYADVVTTGGTMLQGAAMGAAAGATLGPQGAAIGAMLGTAIAATNKLFDIWTQRAREAQQEISNALKVDPNRRASISAYADMLRGLSQERELKMVSGMGTSSLDVIIERAAGKIKDIESKVDSGAYDTAQEL